MSKDKAAHPRPRSIADQYLLFFNYDHYVAARAFMQTKGHDLAQILKDNHSDGMFSKWKNFQHPFDLDKIAAAMQQYDFLWADVPFKDARSLKRKALARTIELIGKRDAGIEGPFSEADGLSLMIGYAQAVIRTRNQFLDRMVSPAQMQEAVFGVLPEFWPNAARRSAADLLQYVRTWHRFYADAVLALRESFGDYATDLDRLTSR